MTACSHILFMCLAAGGLVAAVAGPIEFSDYRLSKRGMSEAQVLTCVGEPDRKTVIDNQRRYRNIWYSLPDNGHSRQFITIISIDANGSVIRLEREKS